MAQDDIRLKDAKAKPIAEVMQMLDLGGLRRGGAEWTGPCPQCGGTDRFSINTRKDLFQCRRCGAAGDQVRLVEFVRGIGFRAALDWLCGPSQDLTPEEIAAREKRQAEHQAAKAREAARYRREAIAAAREVWEQGVPAEDTLVRDYLTRRGIARHLFPRLPAALRFHPACRYMVQTTGHQWREVHRGPAMLAAIQGPDGKFAGVHRTWLDLDQPKGKARITDPDTGEVLATKKSLGSKKGGAIRLRSGGNVTRMIMAEGIETTLSAAIADPDAHIWCGIDLGNLSGQMMHGRGLKYKGIPDMEDADAFVPPAWVRELIFIRDGDSDPRMTQARMLSGCRRAMALRPGLRAWVVPVPEGMDLNDVLMGGQGEPEGQA